MFSPKQKRERHNESQKRSCKRWPERRALVVANYAKRHPEMRNAKEARRRARQRQNTIHLSGVQKIYTRCSQLRRWFDVVVDHILPLAKGGAHSADNLQIIYRLENIQKGAKIGYTPSVIFA